MRQGDRICHKIGVRSLKQLEGYLQREQNHIEGTPKIIVGKQLAMGLQEVWTDDLRSDALPRLKELSSGEKAFGYARRVIVACAKLAPLYGYFIINENMVFLNSRNDILVWINPDILENRVKIYLPTTAEGEAAMTRSIVTYLKLWLRFDHHYLATANNLDSLLVKFEAVRAKALQKLRNQSLNKYASDSRPSFNFEESNEYAKIKEQAKENRTGSKAAINKSSQKVKQPPKETPKLFLSFPNKEKRLAGLAKPALFSEEKKLKFKTSFGAHTDGFSFKSESFDPEFQHKTFNNYPSNTSTNNSVNQSMGLKSGSSYFPNRTTSNKNKNHPIVQLINSQDSAPDEYCPNKILINGVREEEETLRKLKESLEGIGEEVNELFLSNIESENKDEELKYIAAEFENLLN